MQNECVMGFWNWVIKRCWSTYTSTLWSNCYLCLQYSWAMLSFYNTVHPLSNDSFETMNNLVLWRGWHSKEIWLWETIKNLQQHMWYWSTLLNCIWMSLLTLTIPWLLLCQPFQVRLNRTCAVTFTQTIITKGDILVNKTHLLSCVSRWWRTNFKWG